MASAMHGGAGTRHARPADGRHVLAWGAFALWILLVLVQGGLTVAADPRALADGLNQLGWVIVSAAFPLAGIMILSRQPANRVGWILMAIGLLTAEPLGAYAAFALARGLPGGALADVLNGPMWAPPIISMGTLLLLRFPDGNLLSRRWRWVERLSGALIVLTVVILVLTPRDLGDLGHPELRNPLGINALEDVLGAALAILVLIPVAMMLSAASLVIRFRRSSGVEREQLKWLTAAAAIVAAIFLASMVGSVASGSIWGNPTPDWLNLLEGISAFTFVLIPIAIGIAILRYRLYEIDRLISRTLAYAVLTAMLAGVFAGLVVGLQSVALPVVRDSELAVAASTLAVAALFGPLRRRVQDLVDRRFDRARYDATRIADGFGARLRDRLDLDTVSEELASTTFSALRPALVSVWLRASADGRDR